MDSGNLVFMLAVLAFFIVMNALFVAAEYALIRLRKSRVEEMLQSGKAGAGIIQKLQQDINRSIAGSQLGITLCSLAVGAIGHDTIMGVVNKVLALVGAAAVHPPAWVSVVVTFLILSLLHLIIGEQVPKFIALRQAERVSMILARPFSWFCKLTYPLLTVMSFFTECILKLFGMSMKDGAENHAPSTDEFQILFEESVKAGTMGKQESGLLQRALELKDLKVRDVMVPRPQMNCIADDLTMAQVLAVASKTKHTKLPVYRGTRDSVIGILNTKDLFDVIVARNAMPAGSAEKPFKLTALVRQAHFAPDSMPASALLEEMRTRRLQMAMVTDEFGATIGLVTLEDLVEQLVGEIWDEYDKPQAGITEVVEEGEGVYNVIGDLTLLEFNKHFGTDIYCSGFCSTIAGAVTEAIGRLPQVGDTVELGGLKFTVLDKRGNAIAILQVRRIPVQPEGQTAEASTASGGEADPATNSTSGEASGSGDASGSKQGDEASNGDAGSPKESQ